MKHGLLLCGGIGERYAKSIGASPPFPKHLERAQGKIILEQSIHDMVELLSPNLITIVTNAQFHDKYLDELRRIQRKTPDISLSIAIKPTLVDIDFPYEGIAKKFDSIIFNDLNLRSISPSKDSLFIVAPGDQVINWGASNLKLSKFEISNELKHLNYRDLIAVGDKDLRPMYYIGSLQALEHSDYSILPLDQMQIFNINTREDLISANRLMGEMSQRIGGELK